ncbi:MAG: TPM domain-containing protein [Bacteroidota bacterium]
MKYLLAKTGLLLVGLFMSLGLVGQSNIPAFKGFVNDYSDILTLQEESRLEQYLTQFAEATSNEIVVVTMDLPDGAEERTFTGDLAREWGVGQKGQDNGVVLAIYMNARRMVIEVGYGLEGAIPDIVAYNVIDKDIRPSFREGNYYVGISRGVSVLTKAAKGEIDEAMQRRYYQNRRSTSSEDSFFTFILPVIIMIIFITLINRGNGGRGRGGGYGGGGWYWGPTYWGGGYGGGSSGGGFSGGGFDGGSFGGFGGGDFGGGGASGGW